MVVNGTLYKVHGQEVILVPVLLDTVVAHPVRSCPTQNKTHLMQEHPVLSAQRTNREPIPITTTQLAVVQSLSLPGRALLALPLLPVDARP